LTESANGLEALIRGIEGHIEACSDGLPEEVFLFLSRTTPLVNVDLLIQNESAHTLLTWRQDRFFGPGWHVPGGVIRYKEPAGRRIGQVARHELGAVVAFDPVPILVHENIRPDRRDRAHAVSLLYRCRLTSNPDPRLRWTNESPAPGQWAWHERCPDNLILEQSAYASFIG
jgi:ADP-ribose pyrophosphatase YjhB (NUDIX family)